MDLMIKIGLFALILIAIGFVTANMIPLLKRRRKYVGRIIVNTRDVDKDVFRMELDCNPVVLADLSEVTFEIVRE